jgi:hypothetical protein
MSRYKKCTENVTELVLKNQQSLISTLWKENSALAIDDNCDCQMGQGDLRTSFSCAQCKTLRRIIDFRYGAIERPFLIECGDMTGKNLVVSKYEVGTPFLIWDEDASKRAKVYADSYLNLISCGSSGIKNIKCIAGDSFTIRMLITWMISKIFTNKGLPNHFQIYTAFICKNVGYYLYEQPSIGSLYNSEKVNKFIDNSTGSFKVTFLRSIILQLLVIIKELSKINFSHGNPSTEALIFNKEPVSYLYEDVHIESEVTLMIGGMWNSSATFSGVHYFTKNIKSAMQLDKSIFTPEITTKQVSTAYCDTILDLSPGSKCIDKTTYEKCIPNNTTIYRLSQTTIEIYNAMRHIGFPLYTGSFDFYCFMVSLMCNKSFYYGVTTDTDLNRLWLMMWLPEDIERVDNEIKKFHITGKIATSNNIIEIVRSTWLRCDILSFIWDLVKHGW